MFSFLYDPRIIEHYFWCVGVVKNDGMSSKTRLEWQNKEVGSWLSLCFFDSRVNFTEKEQSALKVFDIINILHVNCTIIVKTHLATIGRSYRLTSTFT